MRAQQPLLLALLLGILSTSFVAGQTREERAARINQHEGRIRGVIEQRRLAADDRATTMQAIDSSPAETRSRLKVLPAPTYDSSLLTFPAGTTQAVLFEDFSSRVESPSLRRIAWYLLANEKMDYSVVSRRTLSLRDLVAHWDDLMALAIAGRDASGNEPAASLSKFLQIVSIRSAGARTEEESIILAELTLHELVKVLEELHTSTSHSIADEHLKRLKRHVEEGTWTLTGTRYSSFDDLLAAEQTIAEIETRGLINFSARRGESPTSTSTEREARIREHEERIRSVIEQRRQDDAERRKQREQLSPTP